MTVKWNKTLTVPVRKGTGRSCVHRFVARLTLYSMALRLSSGISWLTLQLNLPELSSALAYCRRGRRKKTGLRPFYYYLLVSVSQFLERFWSKRSICRMIAVYIKAGCNQPFKCAALPCKRQLDWFSCLLYIYVKFLSAFLPSVGPLCLSGGALPLLGKLAHEFLLRFLAQGGSVHCKYPFWQFYQHRSWENSCVSAENGEIQSSWINGH
jgi:hypothetical protein